jgi:hypothetical protein
MVAETRKRMLEEAEIAARFSESYRRKFAVVINQLNHGMGGSIDREGLRLCVEAMDMMLETQSHIARALASLGARPQSEIVKV